MLKEILEQTFFSSPSKHPFSSEKSFNGKSFPNSGISRDCIIVSKVVVAEVVVDKGFGRVVDLADASALHFVVVSQHT